MGYDMNDLCRDFRNKVRDTEEMKDVYRKVRGIRDSFIKEAATQADDFLDYFKSLPFGKQIEMLVHLYELLFGDDS